MWKLIWVEAYNALHHPATPVLNSPCAITNQGAGPSDVFDRVTVAILVKYICSTQQQYFTKGRSRERRECICIYTYIKRTSCTSRVYTWWRSDFLTLYIHKSMYIYLRTFVCMYRWFRHTTISLLPVETQICWNRVFVT